MTSPDQPAFPELAINHFQAEDADGKHDVVVPRWMGGLTKREYFAGVAMQGIISNDDELKEVIEETDETDELYDQAVARNAVIYADALIAELNKEPE